MAKKEIVPTTKSGIIAALAEAGEITKKQADAIYTRLLDLSVKGAKQEEKGYMLPYHADGKRLVKIGIRFDSTQRTISDWKIKEE